MLMDKKLPFNQCPICGAEIIEIDGIAECRNGHKTEEMLGAYAELLKNKEAALEVVSRTMPQYTPQFYPRQATEEKNSSGIDVVVPTILVLVFAIIHESMHLEIMPFGLIIAVFLMFAGGVIWKYYWLHKLQANNLLKGDMNE